MVLTTSGNVLAGYMRAMSWRCATKAVWSRRCLLWPVLALLRAGCSSNCVVHCPVTRLSAAKHET